MLRNDDPIVEIYNLLRKALATVNDEDEPRIAKIVDAMEDVFVAHGAHLFEVVCACAFTLFRISDQWKKAVKSVPPYLQ